MMVKYQKLMDVFSRYNVSPPTMLAEEAGVGHAGLASWCLHKKVSTSRVLWPLKSSCFALQSCFFKILAKNRSHRNTACIHVFKYCVTFVDVTCTNPGFINNLCTDQPNPMLQKNLSINTFLQVHTACHNVYYYKIKRCSYCN